MINLQKTLKIKLAFSALLLGSFSLPASAGILADTAAFSDTSEHTSDFAAVPPFIETATGKPSVVLAFDVSGSMLESAYEKNARKGNDLGNTYSTTTRDGSYYGYFDSASKYRYDYSNDVFWADANGAWDGDFLNWLTMRRVDVARKVMVGGKVHRREGETLAGEKVWVLEGEVEYRSADSLKMYDAASASYSPIPNNAEITISKGVISAEGLGGDSSTQTRLSDDFEMGIFSSAPDAADYTAPNGWGTVNFINTYDDPVFVAVSLTYHGADPSIARAHNITATSAQVSLVEWKTALDGHGSADEVFYIVAEAGCHDIDMADGSTTQFCAGNDKTTALANNTLLGSVPVTYATDGGRSFSSTPAVFTGISSYNDTTQPGLAVRTQIEILNAGFSMALMSNQAGPQLLANSEELHWIAIDKNTGKTRAGSTLEVGEVSNVNDGGVVQTFSSDFSSKPFLGVSTQAETALFTKSYFPRIGTRSTAGGGDGWAEDEMLVSLQASDNGAVPDETVAYIAVKGPSQPRIRLVVDEEPTGLVQKNAASVNFGLSVYNFDHKENSMNTIIGSNRVHGQTMNPCYPIFDSERLSTRQAEDQAGDAYMEFETVVLNNGSERDYLCVPTGVHAPNDKVVQVIEEYPMIWGTTAIAETMIEIGKYARQESPQYNGGNMIPKDGSPAEYLDFGIGTDWDPYYDREQGKALDCKKVFALNFNDGAPYRDYDGSGHATSSPYFESITGDVGEGDREALDNVALALRKADCRSDVNMPSHQEVISYYVFAALDDEEQSGDSLRKMMEGAARGGFVDEKDENGDVNYQPDPMWPEDVNGTSYDNFYTYSQLDPSLCPVNEWDSDGDCVPDTFYLAQDGDQISEALQKALDDILARVASGGAASVVSTTSSGDGAVFQSSFYPSTSVDDETARWYGDIEAWMIDSHGLMRNDGDSDGILDEDTGTEPYATDQIMDSCYNASEKKVKMKLSTTIASRPTEAQRLACADAVYNEDPLTSTNVNPLWSAASSLSSLVDAQVESQRNYTAGSLTRHILTALPDTNGDLQQTDFLPATFDSSLVGMLDSADTDEAEKVVNFVRGLEQDGMRNRTLDGVTHRLGDIIYSTPIAVSKPSERLSLLYDDQSYISFTQRYRDRRTMIYLGGNDGMLHAFNGGWYDKANNEFLGSKTGYSDWELGQEVWAYVPYNLLPHVKYLTEPNYGVKDGDHVYFVDQTPYIFDAKIFGADGLSGQPDTTVGSETVATHPDGWGTVMVVGFRTGGGTAEVFPDPADQSSSVTVRPAYLIFDITDPEQQPKLLAEFTHEMLGMSLSTPTTLTVTRTGSDPDVDWFLMLGSGPSATANGNAQLASDQNAHLFLLNLKSMSLQSGFGTNGVMDLGAVGALEGDGENAFVGDLVAADFDLNVTTDAVYFGTVQGLDTLDGNGDAWPDADNDGVADGTDNIYEEWSGVLSRLRILPGASADTHLWKAEVMYDANGPIVSRPSVSFDKNLNRWIHAGTGRYFNTSDSVDDTDGILVGIKEPRDVNGVFDMAYSVGDTSFPTVSSVSALADVTDVAVTEETGTLSASVAGETTVQDLEETQMRFNDSATYVDGWIKDLGIAGSSSGGYWGERAMGSGVILGGFLFQNTYAPSNESCSVVGASQLHTVRYTTGTAWYKHVLGDPDDDTTNVDPVLDVVTIGDTPSSTPSAHLGDGRGDGEATLINMNSDKSSTSTAAENLEGINSKETSWREL